MRFFTEPHQFYCGVDLHARSMYLCILDQQGRVRLHRNLPTKPDDFLEAIEPFRPDIVVGAECLFTWYWLADLCAEQDVPFVLGHALYMKAIHGGKAKNDRIDSRKIAGLLRGGNFPMAYVYPAAMRATRDLLRRRNHLTRKRADLLSHIQNTNSQYNMEPFGRRSTYKANRSYARLIKCAKESAGKRYETSGAKIGNANLKWAISEAAVLFLRNNLEDMKYRQRLQKKHGKAKSLSILAHKLGRAAYSMLKRDQAFDLHRFVTT